MPGRLSNETAPPSPAPLALLLVVAAAATATGEERLVGYYTAWSIYARDYQVADIPAEHLTHINYAFANVVGGRCVLGDPWADVEKLYPGDTWEQPLRGNFNQLLRLKARHPHLRTLISVGGWTWSGGFSDAAQSAAVRARFASSCVDFVERYGFDGVDIDWEYPVAGGASGNVTRPEDGVNFTRLLAELRRQLDARERRDGGRYLLTIAAPAGPSVYRHLELAEIHEHLDWVNLMAYDFAGGWSPTTGLHAALYPAGGAGGDGLSADTAVRAYLTAGVPPVKLHLGVPFYGRGWRGVAAVNRGLGQTHQGVAAGTWEPGVLDFADLAQKYVALFARHWHDAAQAPWLYDAEQGVFISYDDPESLRAKARYVRERGLGGVMAWEISADDDAHQLLTALEDELRDPRGKRFVRGDCDADGEPATLADAMLLLRHAFAGGVTPQCRAACDADADGAVAALPDALYLLAFAFLGGPAPTAPFPECAASTLDADVVLGCDRARGRCR